MASSVDAKLLRKTKFPPEFNQKVDMQKVNVEVMKRWIAQRMSELLHSEDDIVIELCYNLLESSRFPDIKTLQIQLTGFLDKDTAPFCKEMWNLFLSAQANPQGVPKELLEAKKLELLQEKVNAEKAAEAARKSRNNQHSRENDLNRMRERERGDRDAGRGRGGGRGGRQFDDRRSQWNPRSNRDGPRERDVPMRDRDVYVPPPRDDRREPPKRRPRSRSPTVSRSRSTSRSTRSTPPRRKRSPSKSRSRSRSRSHNPDRRRTHRPRRGRSPSSSSSGSSRGRKRRHSPNSDSDSRSRSRSRASTRSPPPKRLRSLDRTDKKGRLSRDNSPGDGRGSRRSAEKKGRKRARTRSRSSSRSRSRSRSASGSRSASFDNQERKERLTREHSLHAEDKSHAKARELQNKQQRKDNPDSALASGKPSETLQIRGSASQEKDSNKQDDEAQKKALKLREVLMREKVKAMRRQL